MIQRQFKTSTRSPAETRELGRKIGALLTSGMVLALKGDLGCGKTCLVQGIANGLAVPDTYYVTSPSYTLINEYPGRLKLFHIDLYRIENPIDFNDIGLYDILDGSGIAAIEWAEKLLPEDLTEFLSIELHIRGDDLRDIHISAHGFPAVELLKKLENM